MIRSKKPLRRSRQHRCQPRVECLESRRLLAAEVLQVTVENLSPIGGLTETPVWIGFHDGNFEVGRAGESASGFGGLELIAEDGDASALSARFGSTAAGNDAVILAPGGFAGAPVLEPGETVTENVTIDDTEIGRFFSYASMIVPSNDAFVANLDSQAFEIFDENGVFLGARSIVIYGSQVWDAGTEVNDPTGGAAFATAGGVSADENGVIHPHEGLEDFLGAGLPTGENLQSVFTGQTPLARITLSLASNPTSPIDDAAPLAEYQSTDLESAAGFHEFTVTYSDASGIDLSSIDTADVQILTPFLTTLDVLSVTTSTAGVGTPRVTTATYRVASPDGPFSSNDNGVYSVSLVGGEVGDVFAQSAAAESLGEFAIDIPVRLQVTVENLSADGGLGETPFWVAVHNGDFEIARAGVSTDGFAGTEALAEGGDVSGLVARFATESGGSDTVITAPDGFAGAPVFEPGEVVTQVLDVSDPEINRFFSYASMIIPSNDAFIANLDPRQLELFDQFGQFTGARSITIYGFDIWDAGTELNDPQGGAAFATAGGASADESGVVRRHDGLDDFIGSGLPTGESLASAFDRATPIARITISRADAPADPIDVEGPTATLDAGNVIVADQDHHEVTVTYSDPSGVDVSSIGVSDLAISGSTGSPLQVIGVSTDAAAGTTPNVVNVTYQLAPAAGSFSTFDNGVYQVSVVTGEVNDTLGNESDADSVGSFHVLVGVRLEITIENLSPEGGLAQTPFWLGFHEGNFEVARAGVDASQFPGLELIAETGDATELANAFAAASGGVGTLVTAPQGFAGAPVFEPGEIVSQTVEIFSTDVNRFFSFASMIIPSNDAFIANLNPREYELFDVHGVFRSTQTITIYGNDVWDAGTEVNGPSGGAAFSTEGGVSVDENGVIHGHGGLTDFIGTGLPTGQNLQSAFFGQTPLARITIGLANSASPIDDDGPVAQLQPTSDVVAAGTTDHEVQVTYTDPSGIDLTRLGTDDIRVIGPLGNELQVVAFSSDAAAGTSPTEVTVSYTLATQDGPFTARDNGRYMVTVQAGSVGDTLTHGGEEQLVGDFLVDTGVRLQIQVESLTPDGGLGQTPVWVGFHNGSFEIGRAGVAVSQFAGLEELAEDGDVSGLVARFGDTSEGVGSVIAAPDGFAGAPVFEPGESVTQLIEITAPHLNQFFSFASMVIPSNDAFVANLDPRQYQLFDAQGNFQGARSFTIRANQIWDAGSEVNDPAGGAAFATAGGQSADENGVVHLHDGLTDFIGAGLPTGQTLGNVSAGDSPMLRITITLFDPEAPACSGVLGACSVSSVGLTNTQLALDVNDSGTVSALDALLVINFLDRFGSASTISDDARSLGTFLDVTDDGLISGLDALRIINHLIRETETSTAEGEAVQAVDVALSEYESDSEEDEDSLMELLALELV